MSNPYNFDLNTIRTLNVACCEIEIHDSKGKLIEPDCTLLHEFFEANEDAFTPVETLHFISDLLKTGVARLETGTFDFVTVHLNGIIAHDSEQWEFDRRIVV